MSINLEIAVLRPPLPETKQPELESVLDALEKTIYQKGVSLKEAPTKTDCITSIHYIFQKAFNYSLPRAWVGDMPRELSQSGWTKEIVSSKDVKVGDLIFLKRRSEQRLVIHAALVIGPDRIFHCKRDAGAVIESIAKVWEVYEQALKSDLLRYVDYRNVDLRNQYGVLLPSL